MPCPPHVMVVLSRSPSDAGLLQYARAVAGLGSSLTWPTRRELQTSGIATSTRSEPTALSLDPPRLFNLLTAAQDSPTLRSAREIRFVHVMALGASGADRKAALADLRAAVQSSLSPQADGVTMTFDILKGGCRVAPGNVRAGAGDQSGAGDVGRRRPATGDGVPVPRLAVA